MKQKYVVWPLLGASQALLFLQGVWTGSSLLAVGCAIGGAAIGLGVAALLKD
jgi:hypothetical protein